MKYRLIALAVLFLITVAVLPADASHIFWASDPVRAGEVLMVEGEGFGADAAIEIASLDDHGSGTRSWNALPSPGASPRCVKAVLPAAWSEGVFVCRVRDGSSTSNEKLVNGPAPWWIQGDLGASATPGGWLRVFGKCLSADAPTQVLLRASDGTTTSLRLVKADPWSLQCELAPSIAPGDYEVSVRHRAAANAGRLHIVPRETWKPEIFDVRALGGKIEKALEKAKANGGGVIHFPRGRYPLPGPITLPPHTELEGEGMGLVSLIAPVGRQSAALIKGSSFVVRDLSIYVEGEHGNVIEDSADSVGVRIERVRIRANSHFMVNEPDQPFHGRVAPKSQFVNGAAVAFTGSGFQVTDCDIYAANRAMWFRGTHDGLVARNQLRYGGRAHGWDHIDGLIFEENEIAGVNLNSIGNDISTFWGKACEHLYYARNRVHDVYGADREMVTLDAGGGAYFGQVAASNGARLTLAADPNPQPTFAWSRPDDWRGAVVAIMDGTGAGQYRRVVKYEGREWELDAPWEIPPDAASMIQITYFRGRQLYIDNDFTDGGAVQMYGSAFENILAGNRGTRMDGFLVQGLNPHDFGHQPAWYCQLLDNKILEGNGFGGRTGGLGVYGSGAAAGFAGPMALGIVLRRNILDNNAAITIGGSVRDVIIENCVVRQNETGVRLSETAVGVTQHDNRFENVTQPLVILPAPKPGK